MLRRRFPAAIALLALACVRPAEPPPARSAAVAPAAVQGVATPLTATWQELGRDGSAATLAAVVERVSLNGVPVQVRVAVPEGAVLYGERDFSVPASDGPVRVEKRYRVSWTKVPQGDLVLHADMTGPDFGVHAKDAYRFGRPPPPLPAPKAAGPDIEIGGHNLGPAVPVGR